MIALRWLFMTKAGWLVLLIAGLLTVGYGIYNREIARAEARGEVRQLAAQVEAMRDGYRADSAAFADSLDQQQAIVDSLAERVSTAVRSIGRWRQQARSSDVRLDSALAGMNDTAVAVLIGATVDTLRTDLEACADGLTDCDTTRQSQGNSIILLTRRLGRADSLGTAQATTITKLQLVQGTGKGCGLAFTAGWGAVWNLAADSGASKFATGPGITIGFGCRV